MQAPLLHSRRCTHTYICTYIYKLSATHSDFLKNQQFKGICVLVGDSLSFRQFSTLTQSARQQGRRAAVQQFSRTPGHRDSRALVQQNQNQNRNHSQRQSQKELQAQAAASCVCCVLSESIQSRIGSIVEKMFA